MIRLIIESFDLVFGERYPNQTNFSTLERGLLKSKQQGHAKIIPDFRCVLKRNLMRC